MCVGLITKVVINCVHNQAEQNLLLYVGLGLVCVLASSSQELINYSSPYVQTEQNLLLYVWLGLVCVGLIITVMINYFSHYVQTEQNLLLYVGLGLVCVGLIITVTN